MWRSKINILILGLNGRVMSKRPNLGDIWNWLPVFRAVAETEHLPSAAKRLHVTPAAISRTLGLIEDRLGQSLFNRTGKRLVLNGNGRTLLGAVSEAMASVERGLNALDDDPFLGPVRVSAVGVLTNHYVLPALLELRTEHPALRPELTIMGTRGAAAALVRGSLDVAFIYESMTLEGIKVERVGVSESSVYCGRGHPLFEVEEVTLERALEYPFSVPQVGDTGQVVDGWPSDLSREIGMRITLLTSNVEICRSGEFLTVLPDITAMPYVRSGQLKRLGLDVVPGAQLFAALAHSDDGEHRAQGVIEAVKERVEAVDEMLRAFREG